MTKSGSKKMRAYVLIETAPGKTKAVKKELVAIEGSDSTVVNLDAVTGPFDFIAVVEGPTLDAVGRLVTHVPRRRHRLRCRVVRPSSSTTPTAATRSSSASPDAA